MKEFYRHYRVIHDVGDGLTPHGGVTVYVCAGDRVADATFAVCSTKDNYCKNVGRTIALGRYEDGRLSFRYLFQFADVEEFEVKLLEAALEAFWNANRNHMGHWLRRSPARKKARREEMGDGATP